MQFAVGYVRSLLGAGIWVYYMHAPPAATAVKISTKCVIKPQHMREDYSSRFVNVCVCVC